MYIYTKSNYSMLSLYFVLSGYIPASKTYCSQDILFLLRNIITTFLKIGRHEKKERETSDKR